LKGGRPTFLICSTLYDAVGAQLLQQWDRMLSFRWFSIWSEPKFLFLNNPKPKSLLRGFQADVPILMARENKTMTSFVFDSGRESSYGHTR
jgi:hypothetical protein